jgi:hypothetical protein
MYKRVVFPQMHSVFYVFYPENTFRSKNGICRTTVFSKNTVPAIMVAKAIPGIFNIICSTLLLHIAYCVVIRYVTVF